jgi:aminoglycoside 6'-N-acetyltransferase I
MLAKLHQPWGDEAEFLAEIPGWLTLREPIVCWLAFTDDGTAIGMVDARVRNYAEGAPDLYAAYVEDIWVDEGHRRERVATALLAAVEEWARAQGLNWIGSDTEIGNQLSRQWHGAAGFAELEQLINFGKPLD